jgi:hypothetical protein
MNNRNNNGPESVEKATWDLLNRSIDGEISSSEQEQLDHLLDTSANLRDLKEELMTVNRLLHELPEVEPPEYLQHSIERQVRLPAQGHESLKKPGFFSALVKANWLRTGFALAAGVILTIGIYEMGSEPISVRDSANLSGTIVKPALVNKQGTLLDSIQLNTDQLNGLIELRSEGDLISLDVQLKSDGPSEMIVSFSGRGLEFDGMNRIQDPVEAVSVLDGAIHLSGSGEQHYLLSLRRTAEEPNGMPLELDFFADNTLIQKAELNISDF